jgi:hypothetical protein
VLARGVSAGPGKAGLKKCSNKSEKEHKKGSKKFPKKS